MEDVDLLDRRGRLVRLVIAAAIGLVASLAILYVIRGVARAPNDDAISHVSPVLLGMGMFAVIFTLAGKAIEAIARRKSKSKSAGT